MKEKSGLLRPKVQFSLRIHVTSQKVFCDAIFFRSCFMFSLRQHSASVGGMGEKPGIFSYLVRYRFHFFFLISHVNFTVINHLAMQEQERVCGCNSHTKFVPNL